MGRGADIKNTLTVLDSAVPIIYLSVVLIVLLSAFQEFEFLFFLASEESPIQTFSAWGYFLAFATALILHWQRRIAYGAGVSVIFLAMGLRELDFHDRFTTMGIMKTRFYLSEIVPLTEKLIVLLIVLPLAGVIATVLIENASPFWAALQAGSKAAILAIHGIVFTVITKLIDANPYLLICITEETMELAIPFFFFCALLVSAREEVCGAAV